MKPFDVLEYQRFTSRLLATVQWTRRAYQGNDWAEWRKADGQLRDTMLALLDMEASNEK